MRPAIMASPRAGRAPRGAGLVFALVLLGSAGAAAADTTAPATPPSAQAAVDAAAAPPAAPAASDGNELVCKRVRETGSNIGKRVCRTRAQLEAESEAARGMLDQRNRMTNSAGNDEGG